MKTKKDLVKLAVETFQDLEYPVRRYSGRFMFEKECLGVEFDSGSAVGVVLEMIDSLIENDCLKEYDDDGEVSYDYTSELIALFKDAREDNMGRGYIVYWPRIEWDNDYLGEESDEDEDLDDEE